MFYEKTQVLHFTPVVSFVCNVLASRTPVQLKGLTNILLPFSPSVWVATVISVLSMSLVFYTIHKVYDSLSVRMNGGMIIPVQNKLDFLLHTFACLTEPLKLPWFKGFSGGIERV